MAFRSQKAIGAFVVLVFCGLVAPAEQLTIPVRHLHFRNGGFGEIRIGESSITFSEKGKKQKHSREWAFDEIQKLYLGSNSLRILTYEDVRWKLGSDREIEFDRLPEGAAQRIRYAVRGVMDERRLVAALPDPQIKPAWQVKAKLLNGRSGSEGVVLVGSNSIVYKSEEPNASRTWNFSQIDNVSSAGPFDLTITTFERDNFPFAGWRDFRFQLKTELAEDRYNALWQRLNQSRLKQFSIHTQTKENDNE